MPRARNASATSERILCRAAAGPRLVGQFDSSTLRRRAICCSARHDQDSVVKQHIRIAIMRCAPNTRPGDVRRAA